jgi:hypothetical protein
MQGHLEHHCPHRAVPGLLQVLLHFALVSVDVVRVYRW